MELIHKCLRNNLTVTNLVLSSCRLREEHFKIIASLLKENPAIRYLNLDYNLIRAGGINVLTLALRQNRSLKELSLREIPPNSENDIEVMRARFDEIGLLLSTPDCWLESLNLDYNIITWQETTLLGKALASNKRLKALSLAGNDLMNTGCMDICYGLQSNSTLTKLDLCNNTIGPGGGKTLATILSSTTSELEELDISRNPIRGGMKAIFQALAGNNKLKILKMSKTGVSSECLKQLGDLLNKNKTLTEYSFGGPHPRSILDLISKTMTENTTIKKLDLGDCGMTQMNMIEILQALTTNKTLTVLRFLSRLSSPFLRRELLTDLIKKNTVLQELILGF